MPWKPATAMPSRLTVLEARTITPPGTVCTACGAPRAHSTAASRNDLMRIMASSSCDVY
jgi:hypothetical protein